MRRASGWAARFVQFGGKDLEASTRSRSRRRFAPRRRCWVGEATSFRGAVATPEWWLADRLNSMPKYVVSSTLEDPEWNDTTVLKGDAVTEVSKLEQELDGEIVVPASYQLAAALLRARPDRRTAAGCLPGRARVRRGRLFGETSDKKSMRLVSVNTIGDGLAFVTYEVVKHA